jgi:hypothetical protein
VFFFLNNITDNVQIFGIKASLQKNLDLTGGLEHKFYLPHSKFAGIRRRRECSMTWRRFVWGLLIVVWLGGCGSSLTHEDILSVGQREADLVARKGQPQEVQPGPGGGKVYVYTTHSLDQVAAMGGGAWNKPSQVYYWLNDQGVVTKVARYPYGKRRFLIPSEEKPAQIAQAPASQEKVPVPAAGPAARKTPEPPAPPAAPGPGQPAQPAPKPPPSPAPAAIPGPQETAGAPGRQAAPSLRSDMDAASRLELNMSREEVRRLLGPPERTEGFQVKGRGVIVWFYSLASRPGRQVNTPLVFEGGRLSGWGENYYRRRLYEDSGQRP